MDNEKLKILQMLENGKITTDEAVKLLDLVNRGSEPGSGQTRQDDRSNGKPRNQQNNQTDAQDENRQPGWDFYDETDFDGYKSAEGGFMDELREAALGIGRELGDAFAEIGREVSSGGFFGLGTPQQSLSLSSTLGNNGDIAFEGFNAAVRIDGGNELAPNEINVEVNYRERYNDKNKEFRLISEGGALKLDYDKAAFKSVGFNIRVPKKMALGKITAVTSNAAVTAGDLNVRELRLHTKNASIKAEDVTSGLIACTTINYPVVLKDIHASIIEAKTGNAGITVDDASADKISAVTSNAGVKIRNSSASGIYAKTGNGGIKIEDISFGGEPECRITAQTNNANVTVSAPNKGYAVNLRAKTSNGSVSFDEKNFDYAVKEKNRIEGQSANYDRAERRVDVDVKSSNGKVSVKV
jgi:DUF4097 and DUF4098 domain-containing protein YvlB